MGPGFIKHNNVFTMLQEKVNNVAMTLWGGHMEGCSTQWSAGIHIRTCNSQTRHEHKGLNILEKLFFKAIGQLI